MAEVPRKATPATPTEVLAVLRSVARREPNELYITLMAHMALETGQFQKMMNHSVGNIIATSSWSGDYWRPPWWSKLDIARQPEASRERLERLHEQAHASPPQAPQAFRAYPNLHAGVLAYWQLLQAPRYTRLLAFARQGDIPGFAAEVKTSGYCPDCSPAAIAPTLKSLSDTYRQLVLSSANVMPASVHAPSAWTPVLFWGALAAGSYYWFWMRKGNKHGGRQKESVDGE